MDSQMSACPWDLIDDFRTRGEFERFVAWIEAQVASGDAQEIPVVSPYVGASSFSEKWFRHIASSSVWRLVWPDGPFTGVFEPVE